VTLERLTPVIKRTDLGWLRLSQDDLAEIVRLVRQLPHCEVFIESTNETGRFSVKDVCADLPKMGTRVREVVVMALGPEGTRTMTEVLTVRLARDRCQITARDPDVTAIGVVEGLREVAGNCRRMPMWLMPYFQNTKGRSTDFRPQIPAFLAVSAIAAGWIGVSAVLKHGSSLAARAIGVVIILAMAALLAAVAAGTVRSRTAIFTATTAETPTVWQRHRADITINVVVGLAFYLLGLLTAHL
jgi:hypothetical protein